MRDYNWATVYIAGAILFIAGVVYCDYSPEPDHIPDAENMAVESPAHFAAFVAQDKAAGGVGRSTKWPGVQKLHLKREAYCAWCGRTLFLQVHHIRPFAMNPELHGRTEPGGELDDGKDGTGRDGNLITLCEIPKKLAKTPDEEDHHELKGHSGHFHGGENLNVRAECTEHEAAMRKEGTWPQK